MRRGRKRFRTNDLFIPARPNYHHYDENGGDDDDDDDGDNDDDDDDSVCVRSCRQDIKKTHTVRVQQPFRPQTVIDGCYSSEECYCC